ncbi:zinc ribbon domain-containing protein [Deinococcus malanensis]|uniref:zinc ribbon domain-containing protein n=1 Tax=Deinococcus malanensis TaxID=1706855 RepID=UPI003629965C
MTITLNHSLHPTDTQAPALDQRFDAAGAAWRLLALHARSEAAGEPCRCRAAQRLRSQVRWPTGHGRIPQRSGAAWRAEFNPVADDEGWTALLGRHALDTLVAAFRRTLRDVGAQAPLSAISATPPSGLRLRALVRPVSSLCVEVVGVGPVLAPVFTLPGPAGLAVDVWRQQLGVRLRETRETLTRRLLAGDAQADEEYLRHVARYGEMEARLAVPLAAPCTGPVTLTFLEEAELEQCVRPGEPAQYRVHWNFRISDLAQPPDPGLIAVDPGIRTLYAWATRYGVGRFDSPLSGSWVAPLPAPLRGQVDRVLDVGLARLSRQELLHCRQVRPVLDAATSLFLGHRYLALEATDLAGMRRRQLDYPAFAEFSGLDLHMQFLREVVRHSDGIRQGLDIGPAGTTVDCAACGGANTMRYSGRLGRCTACGTRRHRDENGALNVYTRAARQLGWAA